MLFGTDITETLGSVGGRTAAHGYNSADEIRKQYTGYERDDESGLDFAQARHYNSNHGRFTSVDPLTASASIKDPQTFNRYSYALNSPYKFTDPLGLLAIGAAPNTSRMGFGSGGGAFSGALSAWIGFPTAQTEGAGPRTESADDPPEIQSNHNSSSNDVPFYTDEDPNKYDYGWEVSRKENGPYCAKNLTGCGQDVLDFNIILDSDSNNKVNGIYAESFGTYYTIAVLEHLKTLTSEETELTVSAGGKISFDFNNTKPVSGEVSGSVEKKFTSISIKDMLFKLNSSFHGENYSQTTRHLADLNFVNPKTGQSEKVGLGNAQMMITYANSLAKAQARKASEAKIRTFNF